MSQVDSIISQVLQAVACALLFLVTLRYLIKLFHGFWTCWLGHRLGFGFDWRPASDTFAVVTGATDGIGMEYAHRLAEMGYSMVLLSRSQEKLNKVAEEIRKQHKNCAEVKILAVDFANTDIYPKIANLINRLPKIDVLVNNVGIVYHRAEFFDQIPSQYHADYINVNVNSYVKMTELILPKMLSLNHGAIINISALTATFPTAMHSVYGGTKSFQDNFAKSLAFECRSRGVVVQSLRPGFVSTKIIPSDTPVIFGLQAKSVVPAALKTVGLEVATDGHWLHKIVGFLLDEANYWFGQRIVGEVVWFICRRKQVKLTDVEANGN